MIEHALDVEERRNELNQWENDAFESLERDKYSMECVKLLYCNNIVSDVNFIAELMTTGSNFNYSSFDRMSDAPVFLRLSTGFVRR